MHQAWRDGTREFNLFLQKVFGKARLSADNPVHPSQPTATTITLTLTPLSASIKRPSFSRQRSQSHCSPTHPLCSQFSFINPFQRQHLHNNGIRHKQTLTLLSNLLQIWVRFLTDSRVYIPLWVLFSDFGTSRGVGRKAIVSLLISKLWEVGETSDELKSCRTSSIGNNSNSDLRFRKLFPHAHFNCIQINLWAGHQRAWRPVRRLNYQNAPLGKRG